jgi:hypothetical protein
LLQKKNAAYEFRRRQHGCAAQDVRTRRRALDGAADFIGDTHVGGCDDLYALKALANSTRCWRDDMIKYALVCDKGHDFESWFPNSDSFDKQVKRGLTVRIAAQSRFKRR